MNIMAVMLYHGVKGENMEKLFELEDELKALRLEGVNTDRAIDLLHEFINKLQVGKDIKGVILWI